MQVLMTCIFFSVTLLLMRCFPAVFIIVYVNNALLLLHFKIYL